MRTKKAWIAVFALALTATACSKSTPSTGGTTPPAQTTPPVQQTTGGAGSPNCTPNGTQLKEEAENIAFKQPCLAAPADTAFTVEFENKDSGTPHNMEIFSDAAMTQSVFKGDIITGVKTATYSVSALPAGTYHFHCDIHPTMQGELDVS